MTETRSIESHQLLVAESTLLEPYSPLPIDSTAALLWRHRYKSVRTERRLFSLHDRSMPCFLLIVL
jgi:hypothetical protein